jgi:mRNA-degrading endonuclease RelE of RelBE toxin-antitoxin system
MTYQIIAHAGVQRELRKLHKKDKVLYEHIKKRLNILAEQPELGKPLRNVMKGRRRVQIGSFVLIYLIEKNDNKMTLISFEHHDDAYK